MHDIVQSLYLSLVPWPDGLLINSYVYIRTIDEF